MMIYENNIPRKQAREAIKGLLLEYITMLQSGQLGEPDRDDLEFAAKVHTILRN